MSLAVRLDVPLKRRCSIKWEMPLISVDSYREPALTQRSTETVAVPGFSRINTFKPLGRVSRSTSAREIGGSKQRKRRSPRGKLKKRGGSMFLSFLKKRFQL
jgi:hypothetical protein